MFMSRISHSQQNTHIELLYNTLRIFRSGRTSNNLHQLARNNSLACPVEQNLKFVDHFTGVLRSVVHSVSSSGLFAGMAFSESLSTNHKYVKVADGVGMDLPNRESWRVHTHEGWQGLRRRFRKQKSWLSRSQNVFISEYRATYVTAQ